MAVATSSCLAKDSDDQLWAKIVAQPHLGEVEPPPSDSRDLAALNPTLAGIDLRGEQQFDIPWHAIPLPKRTPVTPLAVDDEDRGNTQPRMPKLQGPRLAMRPNEVDVEEPDFSPVWRSPLTGDNDLARVFSQADKIANAERSGSEKAEPDAGGGETDRDAETDSDAVVDSPGLKPVENEPQLDRVPEVADARGGLSQPPATSPPAETTEPQPTDAEDDAGDDDPSPPVARPKPSKPLTRSQVALRNKMRTVLAHYYRRPLNSDEHDSWEIMHGMLAYGLESKIRQGRVRGKPITAIGWLCYNNDSKRTRLLEVNRSGELRALYGVGVQGHSGQFLAMLAQCNVTRTYPIHVDNREFTIEDLIVSEQKTCYADSELTFKLIGLMHYLPSDATWLNDRGEQWSIDRLIAEELKAPIRGAACGGTHRLAGLSLAAKRRVDRAEPLDGEFARAAAYTAKYEALCYRLQNGDGSLSTEWFRGPGDEKDLDRRIRTTGHQLEWLLYHIKDEKLDYWRTVRAVNYLTNILYSNADHQWDTGAMCHALHALVLYDERKFQPYDGDVPWVAARTKIPAASKSPTKDGYGPTRDDDRNSGFRLFGGRR